MGYTHYWYHKREFTKPEWEKVKTLAEAIFGVCKQHRVQLISPMGSYFEEDATRDAAGNLPPNVPLVTDDEIGFNGNPDCEGFVLDRSPSERERAFHKAHQERMRRSGQDDGRQETISFACCKTRQQPYDIAVVAMLAGSTCWCRMSCICPAMVSSRSWNEASNWQGGSSPPCFRVKPIAAHSTR